MIRKYLLPVLAAAGLVFSLWRVAETNRPVSAAQPVIEPAHSPFASRISGAGLVEARTENIAVGSVASGVVQRVYVRVGQRVKAGDPLFALDDRDKQAELLVRQAQAEVVQARLARLQELPRAEDIPPAEARVRAAEAALTDARNQWELANALQDKRAISTEELDRRRMAVQVAEARLVEAQSNLALLKAGAWAPEIQIARAELAQAEAAVQQTRIDLERLVIRAPVDSEILQVNIRGGEFAQTGRLDPPLLLIGDTSRLHVRVDIDENDAWRFRPDSPARGYVRGNSQLQTELRFVRVEPYVVPKRSLTGDSRERVDTRVLQVLYEFDPATLPVYVGQQMDVYIQAPPPPGAASGEAPPAQ